MKTKRLAWLYAVVAGASVATAGPVRDLQKDYDVLVGVQTAAMDRPEPERAALIAASYREHFQAVATGNLQAVASADLDLVFRAATIAAGYTLERAYVTQMKAVYDVLAARNAIGGRHPQSMLEAFVAARMLEDARRFAQATPSLGVTLPAFRDAAGGSDGPMLWSVQDQGRTLVRRAADLGTPRVVVVAHPLCGFSQAAAAQIARDEALRGRFAQQAIWVLPQTAMIDTAQVLAWEKDHAPFSMAYVDRQRAWPMIDSWATPTFYFFKDGRVVHEVVGWPQEGRKAELLEGLAKIAAE